MEEEKKITEELETAFFVLQEKIEDFAQDMPFSCKAYVTTQLTNAVYLFYSTCKPCQNKDFVTFAYLQSKTKWLDDKFYKIISDLKKWAGENVGMNGKGKCTDMSPLRRRALADMQAWQKWTKNKEYFADWKNGIKRKKLLFAEDYERNEEEDMIKIVKEHFLHFMPTKKKRKETREELSRQTPLFPIFENPNSNKNTNTNTTPTNDDGGVV